MALMFVLVEQAPGAFSLRFVSNDELLEELQSQGTLQSFLDDVDRGFRGARISRTLAATTNLRSYRGSFSTSDIMLCPSQIYLGSWRRTSPRGAQVSVATTLRKN
jgi:hypothetical protein